MIAIVGVLVLLGIAVAVSSDRRHALRVRPLAWGLGLQVVIAIVALRTPLGARLFTWANEGANAFVGFADAGITFVFGHWPNVVAVMAPQPGAPGGFGTVVVGFVLAVRVLPLIIFIASLMAV